MSLRISSAVLLLGALAACSSKSGTAQSGQAGEAAKTAQMVPCALAGAKSFTDQCQLERGSEDGKPVLVVRHPGGGFRRLVELEGGKRFAAADGADPVSQEANGKEIEVTVGDDHYLFPGPATANAAHP